MSYDWPETPDVAPAVLARIGDRRPRRWPLVALVLAALAVPAGATALILGIDSAEVRVGTPPAVPTPAPGDPGFEPYLPPRLGTPAAVRRRAGSVVLSYGGGLTLTEIEGARIRPVVQKVVGDGSAARKVPGGVFVRGRHFVVYLRADGSFASGETAASTLLVERGNLLLRLTGRGLTYERARSLLGPT